MNDFEWTYDIDVCDANMSLDEMISYLTDIFKDSRFFVDSRGGVLYLRDETGLYESLTVDGTITLNVVLGELYMTSSQNLCDYEYVLEYRELYNAIIGFTYFPLS